MTVTDEISPQAAWNLCSRYAAAGQLHHASPSGGSNMMIRIPGAELLPLLTPEQRDVLETINAAALCDIARRMEGK
jgi:hypothetical protein